MSQKKRNQASKGYDIHSRREEDRKMWLYLASRIRPPFNAPTDRTCIRIFRETERTWKDFVYLYDAKKPYNYYKKRFNTVLASKIESAPFNDLERLNLHWALGVPIKREYLDKIEATHEVQCDAQWYVTSYKGMNTFEDWPEDPDTPVEAINDYEFEPNSEFLKLILERERGVIRAEAAGKSSGPFSAIPQPALPAPLE